jgi:hypothetical protein
MPLRRIALLSLAMALWAGSASAQEAAPAMNRRPMNLIAMQGPPEPAVFGRAVGLDAGQMAQYGQLRKVYLDATKAERDSLAAMRERMRALRAAGQAPAERAPGERTGGRGPGMPAMRPLVDSLEARFADFEADLAFLLRPEQQKKYDAWKEAEAARMRSEMTGRRQ